MTFNFRRPPTWERMPGGESESMRTDKPTSTLTSTTASTVFKVQAEFQRARRRFIARPAALRWSIGLAAMAPLMALVYFLATGLPMTSGAYVLIRSGVRFSYDDLIAITRALDAKHVDFRIDLQNRVQVAADQTTEANDALAKLDVGPKRIGDIRKSSLTSNPFDPIWVGEQRQVQARNEFLEELLRRLPGIVSAVVKVNRSITRGVARASNTSSAFVVIETEHDHELSSTTVEKIQALIAGAEPEIKHEAVTVFDTTGRNYLDARNPALGAQAHIRAREEELREEILKKLDPIRGVEVSVKLIPGPIIPPPTPLPPLPMSKKAETVVEAVEVPLPSLSMSANQPLEFPDAPPAVVKPEPPAKVVNLPPATPTSEPVPPKARVWVKVPRGYYVRAVRDKDPSLEDYQPLVERTEKLIITAVRHVVPPGQLEEPVAVSVIPEDVPETKVASIATDPRRGISWWIPAGIAAAVSAALTFLVFRTLAGRRPLPRTLTMTSDRGRVYKIDEPSDPSAGPGPSERVRELIRLNPEAAASVLHRWTGHGQGEPIA